MPRQRSHAPLSLTNTNVYSKRRYISKDRAGRVKVRVKFRVRVRARVRVKMRVRVKVRVRVRVRA